LKNLLAFVLLLISLSANSQTIKLYFANDTTNTNVDGQVINKGDTFDVIVYGDGNSNLSARALYFDFEYQNDAFEFISINHTGTGGNGGIIPYGSQISASHYLYHGYSFYKTSSNNTSNGNTNYNFAQYNYTENGNKTILRYYLNWAIQSGGLGKDRLLVLKFKLKTTAQGFAWNPILMNFAAAFNQNGSAGSTLMEIPLTNVIMLDPTASKYVTAKIETNANIDQLSINRVVFEDTLRKTIHRFDALSDGTIPVDQTVLQPNTVYRVYNSVNADSYLELHSAAVTVSDFTTAQAEFNTQNLDGTFKGQSIITGQGYLAADINRNKKFDGGDVVRIFSQAVGVDPIVERKPNYVASTDMYYGVPTFTDSTFNAITATNWKDINSDVVYFKTQEIGKNLKLNLKYGLIGDINRSHSSQVMNGTTIVSNAIPSLKKNFGSPTSNILINTTQPLQAIDVTIKSQTITSNTIEIPLAIDTKSLTLSGLQFEFIYDSSKLKFESITNDLPNTWYTFVNNKDGKIKFGSIDKEMKVPVVGSLVPFKLKFSAINNGSDLNTFIKVSPVMDASSKTGYQLGINLNTDNIKLTGINLFK
jgi:hypothetical protein